MTTRATVRGRGEGAVALAALVLALGAAGCGSGGGSNPPACTPGAEGCTCRTGSVCDGDLQCTDGLCKAPACVAGTMGCPCRTGGACDTGLECIDAACQAAAGTGLFVGSAAARACDVVLLAPDATASFGTSVSGVSARRGDRLALSFVAKGDAALDGPVASVTGGDGKALSGLTPEKAQCYDRLGAAVAEPGVEVK